jgi:hypothetical protein
MAGLTEKRHGSRGTITPEGLDCLVHRTHNGLPPGEKETKKPGTLFPKKNTPPKPHHTTVTVEG